MYTLTIPLLITTITGDTLIFMKKLKNITEKNENERYRFKIR